MAKLKTDDLDIEIKANIKDAEKWRKLWKKGKNNSSNNGEGFIYFTGLVGSLVYWMQAADGFGAVVTGAVKALIWPAYVAYKLLESFYGLV